MLIDTKTYTSINTGLINMRMNVIAIRKTLIRNKSLTKQVDQKISSDDKRLEENARRAEVEKATEEKNRIAISLPKLSLVSPERAFSILSSNPVAAVVSFFSFTLVGWMLKALPALAQSLREFRAKAESFLNSIGAFWTQIQNFFVNVFNSIKKTYDLLISGVDYFIPGTKDKVNEQLKSIANNLTSFITEFPQRVMDFIKGILGLHKNAEEFARSGMSAQEAAEKATAVKVEPGPLAPVTAPVTGKVIEPSPLAQSGLSAGSIPKNYGERFEQYAATQALKQSITSLTAGTVLDLLKRGEIEAAGMYRFDTDTLEAAINDKRLQGRFDKNRFFDQQFQQELMGYIIGFRKPSVNRYLQSKDPLDSKIDLENRYAAITALTEELPLLLMSNEPGGWAQLVDVYMEWLRNMKETQLKNQRKVSSLQINSRGRGYEVASLGGRRVRNIVINTAIPISDDDMQKVVNRVRNSYSARPTGAIANNINIQNLVAVDGDTSSSVLFG